ncbi:MAG TPA: hypothetical protein VF062_06140 [Candidatus Limnocylindrales bacterium]
MTLGLRHLEPPRDRPVAEAESKQLEDIALTRREFRNVSKGFQYHVVGMGRSNANPINRHLGIGRRFH